jgi:cytochrome c-type biogenesis protein CcmH
MRASFIVTILLLSLAAPAFAMDPQEQLKDPAMEARARDISGGLRCLVCQNQSIDDSDAPLARDLRLVVREQLKKGDTNQQVIDYVVARYGDFVLLNPRLRLNTVLLWLAPVLLILGGIALALRVLRRRPAATEEAPPLSPDEEKELQAVLSEDKPGAH